MTKQPRLSGRLKSSAVTALLVVLGVGVSVSAGYAMAAIWGQAAVAQPQPYTALSFVNTGKLPTYSPAGKPASLTFRLTNQEASRTTYHYRAMLVTNSTIIILTEGSVTISRGASVDKIITFTLPQPEMSAQVTVQLEDRTEYITFGTAS